MAELAELVSKLAPVLAAEERLYLELRSLLQREREIMVSLDAAALAELVDMKDALATEARFLEETRIELCKSLTAALALPTAGTLSEISRALGPEGAALADAHARLVSLLGAVKELVAANVAFAGDSLAQVRGTLRLFGRLMPPEPTYRLGSGPNDTPQPGRLVRRSA